MNPPISKSTPRPAFPAFLQVLWALGRVPLLLLVVFLLRRPLLDMIERTFDIIGITEFAIDCAGTPLTRLILAVCASIGYFVVATICRHIFPKWAYLVSVITASLLTAAFSWLAGGAWFVVALVTLLLLTNWISLSTMKRIGFGTRCFNYLVKIPPGLAEAFFSSRYLKWIGSIIRREKAVSYMDEPFLFPGAFVAALALAAFIPGAKLVRLEQALRSGPDVRIVATGDYNDLVFDPSENRLLTTGHGVVRVLGFDVADFDAPPIEADVDTGFAQGFDLDPKNSEIYVYTFEQQEILVLDSHTLELKRKFPVPNLSPGDPWVKYCPYSNTLTVVSEADVQTGDPFFVFDASSGAVLDKRDLEAGNLLLHPDKPILYANFFRRVCGVVAYDLETRSVIGEAPTDARTDRMEFDPMHQELLIASPAEARIERFDPLTLESKGMIKSIFGGRSIEVDEANDVMLVPSLISGRVAMIGLSDHKVKQVWYLGPWLRAIKIAPGTGIAYVSSQKAMYELHYLDLD